MGKRKIEDTEVAYIRLLYTALSLLPEGYNYIDLESFILLNSEELLPFNIQDVSEARDFIKNSTLDLEQTLAEINELIYDDDEHKIITRRDSPVTIANHIFEIHFGKYLTKNSSLAVECFKKVGNYKVNEATTKILLFLLKEEHPDILGQ